MAALELNTEAFLRICTPDPVTMPMFGKILAELVRICWELHNFSKESGVHVELWTIAMHIGDDSENRRCVRCFVGNYVEAVL